MQRILIKMDCDEKGCYIKTVSRENRTSQRFFILREEAEEVEERGRGIFQDSFSFARIWIQEDCRSGKHVRINFFWAKSGGDGCYTGRKESISIPYPVFQEAFSGKNIHLKCLSLPEKRTPKIEFESRRNLKAVMEHPKLRRKLGRFLSRNFQWNGSEKIVLYDDFLPYSFTFCEYRDHGQGIVGGIILHGQEHLGTAQYSMHT